MTLKGMRGLLLFTGLTPELSRATARPQTRTNIPKKIAAVKWHRLERIVRQLNPCQGKAPQTLALARPAPNNA